MNTITIHNRLLACIGLFLLILVLPACNRGKGGKENPMVRINIEKQQASLTEQLALLCNDGIIDSLACLTITDRLIADCDTYLAGLGKSDRMTCQQIDTMVSKSLATFAHIKMNDKVIAIIASTYHTIAAMNQVRTLSVTDIGENCNPGAKIWQWYESQQSEKDKFEALKSYAQLIADGKDKYMMSNENELKEIFDIVSADIERIERDTMLSPTKLDLLIQQGLNKCVKMEMDRLLVTDIAHIYSQLAEIKGLDKTPVDNFLQNNLPQAPPLSHSELRRSATERINYMLEAEFINQAEHEALKSCMIDDIDTFLVGSQSKEQLTERLVKSLAKLKRLHLDTEDREWVAETYYHIALHKDIDAGQMLNKWLYDF